MKFILLTTLFISGSAFAYHSGTNMNHPVKENAIHHDKRQPASVIKEVAKPQPAKVAPKQ